MMLNGTRVAEKSTVLDWALRPFSKVRPGEGLVAALLLACVFLILTSNYLMKTAREGRIAAGIARHHRRLSPAEDARAS